MPLLSLGRDERGFTMVTVIITMMVVMMLSVAALSAAQNDLPAGKHDTDRKIAYAAAEAGVQNYLYHLVEDPTYWSKCTAVSAPVNNRWNGTDTRKWAAVPGARARYTVELLPANGSAACDPLHPESTMIDTSRGTFRIRVTGQALNLDGVTGVKRTIVVNLRRESLLDYVYFTDKEVLDGSLYSIYTAGEPTDRLAGTASESVPQWGATACNNRYWGNNATAGNRGAQVFSGSGGSSNTGLLTGGVWYGFSLGCQEVSFGGSDVIKGPFHTNDEILCSGSPRFGRLPSELIEVASLGQTAAAPTGYRSCTPYVNFGTSTSKADAGTYKGKGSGTGELDLPPSNSSLKTDTAAAYRFVGKTTVVMNGASMTITGKREDGTQLTNATLALPAEGVLYVANSPSLACPAYNPISTAAATGGCGNLEIKGTYSVNVTFTAENDILVTEDTTRVPGSEALLGLIANGFVRVHHPIVNGAPTFNAATNTDGTVITSISTSCTNSSATPKNVDIDASILALTHSFMVDNYHCGADLGTLTVNGAIVQAFRGAVGKTGNIGYDKNYTYDPRLKYRSPPKFLDPVLAAWRTTTYNEQIPAR